MALSPEGSRPDRTHPLSDSDLYVNIYTYYIYLYTFYNFKIFSLVHWFK